MRRLFGIYLFLFFVISMASGQSLIEGIIVDSQDNPLIGATISTELGEVLASTSLDGTFSFKSESLPNILIVNFVGFKEKRINLEDSRTYVKVVLEESAFELSEVEVNEKPVNNISTVIDIDKKSAKSLPSAFGDFNKILVTLPSVASNNELSSAYSVRGGNFDENLIYVNDIPVYRPFLANSGRQEGLSFVNPDLVSSIQFYAGGWEPKYGDKLSSSLNIDYKEPQKPEASITLGLLGGTAHAGGKTDKFSYLVGVRHRDSRYLLGTTEIDGQYFPKYSDFQSLMTFDLTKKNSSFLNKTKLNWLLAYGRNRYLTEPTSSATEFGTFQQNFRLQTAFQGQETLDYDTYQTGFRLTHRFNERFRSHLISSIAYATEKEYYDVEGGYRLCDVNTNPGSSSFDDCVALRGIGTNYSYGRNKLEATLVTNEARFELLVNDKNVVEWGVGMTNQIINDQLSEYSFLDSADYSSITSSTFNNLDLRANEINGFAQNTVVWKDSMHAMTFGVRLNYRSTNDQLLVSPRILYRFSPNWETQTTFKFSVGMYQQPPFYRELRNYEGDLNPTTRAQRSLHFIGSMTRILYMWGRPFLFNTDAYYKHLYDLIPYEIDNVRVRYFPELSAEGYARGVEFRINGEFVKGTQSWFSLGILQTQEQIENSPTTQNRRPFDQRVNLAAYFEDHLPNDPSWRIYLNMVFGSGYPFGPPEDFKLKGAFSGDEYYRVDLGLSKSMELRRTNFNKLWLRLELLNALGADNTLSYTWIEDVNGNNFAIPNSLSARFLNLKVTTEF
ncbi:MAG: carboxypeptidase-like regulatory domain-containing protein [Cyclobacteriaceae bacterium]